MTLKQTSNNAKSAVATSNALNNTTNPAIFSVTTGHGSRFPAPGSGFWVTVWDSVSYPNDPFDDPNMEIMLCTARSGDSLTCTRAEQGTTAVAHAGTPAVRLMWTKGNVDGIQTDISAVAAGALAVKAVGSDSATSIATGADFTKTIAVGAGKAAVLIALKGSSASGAIVLCTDTASEAKAMSVNASNSQSFDSGSGTLSVYAFQAAAPSIFLKSASYNSATGDVTLVFHNDAGGSATLNAFWTIFAF